MTSYTLHNLGNLAQEEGDFSRAHALYAESLELKRSLGDRRGVASLLTSEGFLFLKEQDYRAACSLFMEAGPIARDVGATPDLLTALEGLAWLASVGEHPLLAVRLWAVTAATRETIPAPYNPEEQNAYPALITAVRERVGDRAFQTAWDEGRAIPLSDVLALALREMSTP
jgi:tetratricopeptide (TPR) repeat protein